MQVIAKAFKITNFVVESVKDKNLCSSMLDSCKMIQRQIYRIKQLLIIKKIQLNLRNED